MFYFFHRHNDAGQGALVPAVAEWPGTVSEDGLTLIPPPVPPRPRVPILERHVARMTFQPLPQSPKASQPDSVTATVSSNLTSRRQRVSCASRWKVPVFSPARWRQQRAKPSQGTFSAVSLSKELKNHLLGHFLDTFSVLLLWQKSSGFISDPCSRADSQLKKGPHRRVPSVPSLGGNRLGDLLVI
jgi:hypothetical protein